MVGKRMSTGSQLGVSNVKLIEFFKFFIFFFFPSLLELHVFEATVVMQTHA